MDTKTNIANPSTTPNESAAIEPRRRNAEMLAEIGRLVRQARAKRAMKRKALARASETSERYIAQIEKGDGNPTVLVLDAIARALGLDLLDLLPLGTADETKLALIERARRLPASQAAAALRLLEAEAWTDGPVRRARRVSLIGLRGAGKSTLGAALADRLGCAFVELDKVVEREYGAPVSSLFEVYGQSTFRRYERKCLERIVADNDRIVIATAGGIVSDEQTFAQLLESTHAVWLKASPNDHMRRVMDQGDFRPMARNREAMTDLVAILDAREAEYGRAHAQLDTSEKSIEDCVAELERISEQLCAGAGK